jgi:cytochrome c oxidase cbb3-type subunit IV
MQKPPLLVADRNKEKTMYKDVLTRMEGVDLFPLIALVIFFTFFVLLITWVVRLKRSYVDSMSNMPLDEEEPTRIVEYSGARPAHSAQEITGTDTEQQNNRNPE